MAEGFTHLGDDLVHQGHFVCLVDGSFRAPDGSTFRRDLVRSRGAVGVVPDGRNAIAADVERVAARVPELLDAWDITGAIEEAWQLVRRGVRVELLDAAEAGFDLAGLAGAGGGRS